MDPFLLAEVVISVLLIICVLLQQRAAGLSVGGSGMNTMVVQRRGAEKLLYRATGVLAFLLVALSVLHWYL